MYNGITILSSHFRVLWSFQSTKCKKPKREREKERDPENCFYPTFYKVDWKKDTLFLIYVRLVPAQPTENKQVEKLDEIVLKKNLVKTTTQWLWYKCLEGSKCLFLTLRHPQLIEVASILRALHNYLLNDCFGELARKWILGPKSK